MVKATQLKLAFKPRRGRPPASQKTRASYIWHRSRPAIPKGKPVHVTLKGNKNVLGTLRNKHVFKEIRASMQRARSHGIAIIEFSVQRDHIHLLLEPKNRQTLGKAMRAMTISLSKRLSFLAKRKIKVMNSRYHLHILKTLAEIRRARNCIVANGQKYDVIKASKDWYSSCVPEVPSRSITVGLAAFLDEVAKVVSKPRYFLLQ